jgi:hypothetical protein
MGEHARAWSRWIGTQPEHRHGATVEMRNGSRRSARGRGRTLPTPPKVWPQAIGARRNCVEVPWSQVRLAAEANQRTKDPVRRRGTLVSKSVVLPPISWPFRGVRSRARPASTPRAGHDRIDPCVVCCADFPIRFSFSALVGSQRRTYLRVQCPSVKHTHARSAVTVRPGPVKSKSVLVISRTVTALGSVDRSGPTGTTTHAGPWVAYACVPERASVVALPRLLSLSVSDHRPGKRESVQSSPVRRASPPPVGSA